MRPYAIKWSNHKSVVNTRIKRKDVADAIASLSHLRMAHTASTFELDPRNPTFSRIGFFKLPGEVRNMIYRYALGIGIRRHPTIHTVSRGILGPHAAAGKNLLRVNKHIYTEACTLMESVDVAYIPVMGCIKYEQVMHIASKYHSPNTGWETTVTSALTGFSNVHLHAHTGSHAYDGRTGGPDGVLPIDADSAYLYGRIRQVLIIYVSASLDIFNKYGGTKRRAMLHLDHLLSDWMYMVTLRGSYNLKHLIRIMGEDVHTDWSLHYYVYTADMKRETLHWEDWDEECTRQLDCILELCKGYANIKVVAEVYGELVWSAEGVRSEVTRCVTASSRTWPSWPEKVPWRLEAPGMCPS